MTIRLYDQHSTSFDFNPGASLPFADIAELAAFDDRQISDGGLAYTSTVRSLWIKRVVSPVPTADGITIVATASGDGAWYRSTAPSLSWQTQATWYIDPAAGDDENDGNTTGTALATFAEFNRRLTTIVLHTTVTILSNISEALVGHFSSGGVGSGLIITGLPTVLASGGGAGHSVMTNPVPATNSRGLVSVDNLTTSAGAAAVLSTYVGKMLRCPSIDTNGVFLAPALKASGNDVNVPWWTRVNISNTKPVDGAIVEVLDLITCPTVQIDTDMVPVQVRYLSLTSTSVRQVPSISVGVGLTAQPGSPTVWSTWFGCVFGYILAASPGMRSEVFAALFTGSAGLLYTQGGRLTLIGGGSTVNIQVVNNGTVSFQGFVIEGAKLLVGSTSRSNPLSVAECVSSESIGIFSSPGNAIEVIGGSHLRFTSAFGSGNAGYGLMVDSGGSAFFSSTPTVTGTLGDLQINSATTAVPPPSALGVWVAAADLSGANGIGWAKWVAAPFSRNVMSYANGSKICGT